MLIIPLSNFYHVLVTANNQLIRMSGYSQFNYSPMCLKEKKGSLEKHNDPFKQWRRKFRCRPFCHEGLNIHEHQDQVYQRFSIKQRTLIILNCYFETRRRFVATPMFCIALFCPITNDNLHCSPVVTLPFNKIHLINAFDSL